MLKVAACSGTIPYGSSSGLAASVPTWLLADVSGKAAADVPSPWASALMWESHKKLMALVCPRPSWGVNQQMHYLCFYYSLTLLSKKKI